MLLIIYRDKLYIIAKRFNHLVDQFNSNQRYFDLNSLLNTTQKISDYEDISYEMLVNNKTYQAGFYQKPNRERWNPESVEEDLIKIYNKRFTQEQLDNPTEEVRTQCKQIAINYLHDNLCMKPVWFTIVELFGEYSIAMYYDNEYNMANGNDL